MKTYLNSNTFFCRRDVAHIPLPWPVTILHHPREWTPAHKENNTNTSVKSNICNYTSVRKDIIQHQQLQVQREWNHNDSHLFINNSTKENTTSVLTSSPSLAGCSAIQVLQKLEGVRDKLSLFSDKVSLLR